jgi:hypothetical protein
MASHGDSTCTDIVMFSPSTLSSDRKRSLDKLKPKPISPSKKPHLTGSLVISDGKFFEVVGVNGMKCTLKSIIDKIETKCSKLELYPGGKYQKIQKKHAAVIYHFSRRLSTVSSLSPKNPVYAASFMLKTPMLFTCSKGFSIIVNYTGEAINIFEISKICTDVSDFLHSWNVQLRLCLLHAPEIPSNFKGNLIVLAVLHLEGVILLGSHQDSSSSSECGTIYYATFSTTGRGNTVFLEVADRIYDERKKNNHYFSSNDAGFFASSFYIDIDSSYSPKAVASPLTMAKNSDLITNSRRAQKTFCKRLLKEMNGTSLAAPLENKIPSPRTPFTEAPKWTRLKSLFTPAEQILLLQDNTSFTRAYVYLLTLKIYVILFVYVKGSVYLILL